MKEHPDLLAEHADISRIIFRSSRKRERYDASACRTTLVKVKQTRTPSALESSSAAGQHREPSFTLLDASHMLLLLHISVYYHTSCFFLTQEWANRQQVFLPSICLFTYICGRGKSVKYCELRAKVSHISEQIIDNHHS